MSAHAPGPDSGPVWFDVSVSPNLSLTRDAACIMFACLSIAVGLIGAITASFGAWPVAMAMLVSLVAFMTCLSWHAYRLTRYEQRICLTEKALIIETRSDPDKVRFRVRLSPDWLKVERRNADEAGCEAVLLHSGRRVYEIASVLSPSERSGLADALETALRQRRSAPLIAA